MINQYKDPSSPTSILESKAGFFSLLKSGNRDDQWMILLMAARNPARKLPGMVLKPRK